MCNITMFAGRDRRKEIVMKKIINSVELVEEQMIEGLQKAFDKIGKPASLTPDALPAANSSEEEHQHHHR